MATTQNTYTGDGSTTDYTLQFPYIAAEDVRVSLDDVGTLAFSLINANTVRFNSAPGNGVAIRIYRVTDDSNNKIVFNSGSSIRANDLNDGFNRNLFIAQELQSNLSNVTAGEVADGSLATAKLADSSITTAKIAPSAVTTSRIADANVTTVKITDSSVTTAKIADANITTAKIVDNAVTEAKVSVKNGFVPTGAVFHFVSSSVPAGYLKCNGDTIPDGSGTVQGVTADFSALYALVGATLPDLRGEFIRGFDDGRGVDSGRTFSSSQASQNLSHSHTASSTINNHTHSGTTNGANSSLNHSHSISPPARQDTVNMGSGNTGIDVNSGFNNNIVTSSTGAVDLNHTHNFTTGGASDTGATTTIASDGGSEARPRNVALLACIKY